MSQTSDSFLINFVDIFYKQNTFILFLYNCENQLTYHSILLLVLFLDKETFSQHNKRKKREKYTKN